MTTTVVFLYEDGKYRPCLVCAWCGKPIYDASKAILRHDIASPLQIENASPGPAILKAHALHKGQCDERWHQAMSREGNTGWSELGTALCDLMHNSFTESDAGAREQAEQLSAAERL